MDMNLSYDKKVLNELVKTYLISKALYETIHEKEIECETRVLESRYFYESEEWAEKMKKRGGSGKPERILKPDNSYLMTEEDAQEYYTLIYEEYKKEGIDHPKGRCYIPSSESRGMLKQSENLLIDYAIDIAPEEIKETLRRGKFHWKYRDEILNLILKLDCGTIDMKELQEVV